VLGENGNRLGEDWLLSFKGIFISQQPPLPLPKNLGKCASFPPECRFDFQYCPDKLAGGSVSSLVVWALAYFSSCVEGPIFHVLIFLCC